MKITTNNQWRRFLTVHEVPAKVLSGWFSHLEGDDLAKGIAVPCGKGWLLESYKIATYIS